MKNKEEILKYIKDHPLSKVKLAITDIDGILRGKEVRKDKFYGIIDAGFGFCDVVFGWDSSDVSYDNGKFTGWHTGYPDAHAVVDINTFRKIPWEEGLPFFLADFESEKDITTLLLSGETGNKIINFENYNAQTIGIILLWLSAALTLFTGYDYMRKGIDHAISEDNKN